MTHERDLAFLLTRIARCVDRTAALLAQATDLHRELMDLHAETTSAALDLEKMLKQADTSSAPAADRSSSQQAP